MGFRLDELKANGRRKGVPCFSSNGSTSLHPSLGGSLRKQRKSVTLIAVLAGVSLIAAACGDDDDPETTGGEGTTPAVTGGEPTTPATEGEPTTPPTDGETTTPPTGDAAPGGTVTFASAQEFSSLNNNTADQNSVKNGIVTTAVLPDLFPYGNEDGYPFQDESIVESAEVTGEDPQVVEYVLNPDAVWSDGEPISCKDFYLAWVAQNGVLKQLDDAGQPVVDPTTEEELLLFQAAGTTGWEQIESFECSEDGKGMTTTYSAPFADWQTLGQDVVPAHVVEREAGVDDVVAAYESEDTEALAALADFWNTGFTPAEPGTVDPAIFLSGDAFIIDSWEPGNSITLVANPSWWGEPAGFEQLVIRFVAEEAQAQALANGEINTMYPQPTPDLITQLESNAAATVETSPIYTWEHFDFNFRNPKLQNIKVRQAFALCLPREQMLQNLIHPMVPDAVLLNNRWIQEFEADYVDNSGGGYDAVDLEQSAALLQEAAAEGVELPVDIRLGWNLDQGNVRRVNQVAATIESCNQVEGFNVTDAGDPAFFEGVLDAGEAWDVAMFAWAGSPAKSGSIVTYTTTGGNNNGRYANDQVDTLSEQLAQSLDTAEVVDLANQIDTILWEDLATIPLYSHPGVTAYDDTVTGVISNPSQNGLTWNSRDWQAA
jgi:peptide/nickel transport system substrate-binding protein